VSSPLSFGWRPRHEALEPCAAWASDAARLALLQHLIAQPEERLARLTGLASKELLVVLGPAAELPWVDGVKYLGIDARAPGLLLPTQLEPEVHPALVERGLRTRFAAEVAPLAVLLEPARVASLASARPLERARLVDLMERPS